jgi:NAD(P)-dependent dehydrogenase (short-subunit alcohol dehydrogenase family)
MSLLDRFKLEGETAIVTGGNQGIGYAISEGLAEVGANVVIANRSAVAGREAAEAVAENMDANTLAVATDVTEEGEVKSLIDIVVDEFGSVDVLVNNAGVAHHEPAVDKTVEEFRETIEINLVGAFLCSKYAALEMMNGDGGSIINVSSMSAFIANYPQCHVDYQASKAGMEGMKTQLASEWSKYNIRVNNINPGYVNTDILAEDSDLRGEWKQRMLHEEFADPEDIAPLAAYLASDASSYVTGTSVLIDGGYTVR